MKYSIPEKVINWDNLKPQQLKELYEAKEFDSLCLSYLYYHDVPFELACNARDNSEIYKLEKVFARNDELLVTIPENGLRDVYSMQGIQKQYNEVIRNQYYNKNDSLPLGAYLYYIEASVNPDNTINKQLTMIPVLLDRRHIYCENKITELCEKFDYNPYAVWIAHSSYSTKEQSRRLLYNYLRHEVDDEYKKACSILLTCG